MSATDTFTSNTGQVIQQAHTNLGIWGPLANSNFQISDKLFGGVSPKVFSNADITVVDVDGSPDDGKNSIFVCSGTLTADVNLIFTPAGRHYLIVNNCTGAHTLTVKTVSGTGVVVAQGATMPVYCDGTDILAGINNTALGLGTMAEQDANNVTITGGTISGVSGIVNSVSGTSNRITSTGGTTPTIDISGSYVGQSSITTIGTVTSGIWNAGAITSSGNIAYTGQAGGNVQPLTDASTIAWDMNLGGIATVTPSTNRTMGAPTNIKAGYTYALRVTSGGFTLTWNAAFKWPGGVAPVSTGGTDIYSFYSFDGTTLDGGALLSFS